MRSAIEGRRDVAVDLLNYRKDGSTFWNALYVSPVVDEDGTLQFYFASQLDVTDRKQAEHRIEAARDHFERMSEQRTREFDDALTKLRETNRQLEQALETRTALLHEVDHRVKNNLQMVSALILLQSRSIPDEAVKRSLQEMLSRVEALGTVHRRLYQSDDVTRFDVGEFVRDLVTDIAGVSSAGNVALRFDLATVTVPAEHAAPIALIVNEIATNALKHAFPAGRNGTLSARVASFDDRIEVAVDDDGVGENVTGLSDSSFGTSLIRTLSRQLKADVRWTNNEPGTRVTMDIPIRWGASRE